jgi:hypothetical protein
MPHQKQKKLTNASFHSTAQNTTNCLKHGQHLKYGLPSKGWSAFKRMTIPEKGY